MSTAQDHYNRYMTSQLPPDDVIEAITKVRKWAADNGYIEWQIMGIGPNKFSGKYKLGDRLRKIKGSSWTGKVVGFYSTELTPIGYAIESENEPGSVQIYPEAALRLAGCVIEEEK